jgi:hypothetical protein
MKLKSILLLSASVVMFSNSYGQSKVSTGTSKYTLLEEGTGTWCGYCPDGSQKIQQAIEPVYPKAICVSFHNGDAMELTGDPFNSQFITGFPGATIDRKVWSGTQNVNRGQWASSVATQDATTPNFQVDLLGLYDSVTRTITLTVTGKALVALTGSYRINAYITEDSITNSTNKQKSYMYSSSGSWYYNQCEATCGSGCGSCAYLPDSIYSHMHVVTKILAASGSIWGDTAFTNPAINTTKSKTYTYVIPPTSPSKYIKVVGLVQKYGGATTDREIQNAAIAKVRLMKKSVAGIDEQAGIADNIEIYPNPASGNIHVSTTLSTPVDVTVIVTNIMGQVVSENTYQPNGTMFSENISLAQVPNGIYFMNFVAGGERITRKFVVAH